MDRWTWALIELGEKPIKGIIHGFQIRDSDIEVLNKMCREAIWIFFAEAFGKDMNVTDRHWVIEDEIEQGIEKIDRDAHIMISLWQRVMQQVDSMRIVSEER